MTASAFLGMILDQKESSGCFVKPGNPGGRTQQENLDQYSTHSVKNAAKAVRRDVSPS